MTKKSPFTATPGVRLLKSHVTRMESSLRQLDRAMGSHVRAYDKTLNKISGRKPLKGHTPSKLLTQGSSFAGIVAGRLSQRQVWAQAAASISRAMTRDL